MPPKSDLWKHFSKNPDKSAICRHCGKVIKTSGNTSNLKCHMESKHEKLLKANKAVPPTTVAKLKGESDILSQAGPSSKLTEAELGLGQIQLLSKDLTVDSSNTSIENISRPMLQATISSSLKKIESFKAGGALNEKITQAIVYMVCKDNQPFQVVEHKGFKKLLKTVAPQYKIPSDSTIKRLVNDKYEVIADVMKNKKRDKKCTLTSDIWTDAQMRSFMSLTVHFFDDDSDDHQIFNGTLGVLMLEERHTGEYLAEELNKLCLQWEILHENVVAVVTDNGANIKKAVELAFGAKKHIPCFAHTLNLVVERAIESTPEAETLIRVVKSIVTWFKQSVIGSDQLRKRVDKKLIQSVPTRWNSTYYMLDRFLELRPFVNDIVNTNSSAPPMLTAAEIEDVAEITAVLQPLENATNEISGEHYLTSSISIPVAHLTLEELDKVKPKKSVGIKLLQAVSSEFKKRFGQIEHVHLLAVAALLDPRFKKVYFKDPLALSKAINHISGLLKTLDSQKEQEDRNASSSSSESNTDQEPEKKKRRSLFGKHNKTVQTTWRKSEEQEFGRKKNMHQELSLYLDAPAEKIQQNPLQFWQQMMPTYPLLAKVAKTYVSTVSTSVPSERLFSKVGQTLTQSRNRLKGKMLEKLVFLHDSDDRLWSM